MKKFKKFAKGALLVVGGITTIAVAAVVMLIAHEFIYPNVNPDFSDFIDEETELLNRELEVKQS